MLFLLTLLRPAKRLLPSLWRKVIWKYQFQNIKLLLVWLIVDLLSVNNFKCTQELRAQR